MIPLLANYVDEEREAQGQKIEISQYLPRRSLFLFHTFYLFPKIKFSCFAVLAKYNHPKGDPFIGSFMSLLHKRSPDLSSQRDDLLLGRPEMQAEKEGVGVMLMLNWVLEWAATCLGSPEEEAGHTVLSEAISYSLHWS